MKINLTKLSYEQQVEAVIDWLGKRFESKHPNSRSLTVVASDLLNGFTVYDFSKKHDKCRRMLHRSTPYQLKIEFCNALLRDALKLVNVRRESAMLAAKLVEPASGPTSAEVSPTEPVASPTLPLA